ncbi:uncharacterized protein LOC126695356 [Quercus robur]|uniref:uncharacterized protein LOC126695356 n=1 Tax=Quercus robur TaxID=38942 RepID=UPI002162E311|nr:uncharacterized protein LOC126695356 [Quercus robur]
MGNCLSNKSLAQEEEVPKEAEVVEQTKPSTASKLEPVKLVDGGQKKKKVVRFKLEEDDTNVGTSSEGDSRSGVVRIRVVVTQKELKQILDCKEGLKYSSVEQLVNALNLRGRKISEVRTSDEDEGINSNWRPALESIPEDH